MMRALYMLLATAMFYLSDALFPIAGMELSLKNPCAVAIALLGLVAFALTVRVGRAVVLVRHTAVQMLPYMVPLLFSCFIWVVSRADHTAIWSGMINIVPQLVFICVASATLYLFGGAGLWYCLASMCLANFFKLVVAIGEGGFSAFLLELRVLLTSFGSETGPIMSRLELHDLTFALGAFIIYLIFVRREVRYMPLWLVPLVFFFLTGLKRIAIPAIVLGLLGAVLLRLLPEKAAGQAALCLAALMMAVAFLYIVGIRNGLFEYLENTLHINTMGRIRLYQEIAPYYEISITFMGRGVGFERFTDWVGQDAQSHAIHNDFLRMYLNIGFVGYWVWLWCYLITRLRYWFRQSGKDGGCLFFGLCVYCFVLYATDNTFYYPYTSMACALIPMAYHFDGQANAVLEKFRAGEDA